MGLFVNLSATQVVNTDNVVAVVLDGRQIIVSLIGTVEAVTLDYPDEATATAYYPRIVAIVSTGGTAAVISGIFPDPLNLAVFVAGDLLVLGNNFDPVKVVFYQGLPLATTFIDVHTVMTTIPGTGTPGTYDIVYAFLDGSDPVTWLSAVVVT